MCFEIFGDLSIINDFLGGQRVQAVKNRKYLLNQYQYRSLKCFLLVLHLGTGDSSFTKLFGSARKTKLENQIASTWPVQLFYYR